MPINFNSLNLAGPNYNQGNNLPQLLSTVAPYHDARVRDQQTFEKNLMNMQSQMRMRELGQTLALQRDNQAKVDAMNAQKPKNVIYQPEISPLDQMKMTLAAQKEAETERNNKARNAVGQQNADTAAKRAEVAAALARNPNYREITTKGSTRKFIDLKSGEVIDSGVDSGTMTDAEAAETAAQNAKNLETQKEQGRAKLQETRGQQRLSEIKATGEQARETKATPSPNTTANLPSQNKVALQLRANQFQNENPDLASFVQVDPNTGQVSVTPAGNNGWFSNAPTQEQYQKIMDAIYPNGQLATAASGPSSGTVRVKAPNGQTGTWDLSKGAVPSGYTVIGGGQ